MSSDVVKESSTCDFVGLVIMGLGAIIGIIFIFAFGRIEVPSYSGTETV